MWKGKPFLTGDWKIHSTGGTQSYRFIIIISFHFMSSRKWEPELWGWCAQSFSSTELLKDAQKAFCSPKSQVLLEYKPGFLGFWSEESQSGIIQTYLCSWVQNDPVTSITVFYGWTLRKQALISASRDLIQSCHNYTSDLKGRFPSYPLYSLLRKCLGLFTLTFEPAVFHQLVLFLPLLIYQVFHL